MAAYWETELGEGCMIDPEGEKTNGGCLSESRWQAARRKMAQGDGKTGDHGGKWVVAFKDGASVKTGYAFCPAALSPR